MPGCRRDDAGALCRGAAASSRPRQRAGRAGEHASARLRRPVDRVGRDTRTQPQPVEFLDRRGLPLVGDDRRLADLPHLGVTDLAHPTDEQLQTVVEGCDGYFDRNPYWRWFRPLDVLLRTSLGATYSDGSACHLDLSQWATDPVWGGLSRQQQRLLTEQDAPFIAQQLEQENVQVLLLAGRAVLEQMTRTEMVQLEPVGHVSNATGTLRCELLAGTAGSAVAYGWSSNLQSQPGVTAT